MQFPLQKKRKFPPADKSKYCKFHRDYGHDTNDSVTLKDEIEILIRRAKLTKYRRYGEWEVDKNKECERSRSPSRRETNDRARHTEQQIVGTIETIAGGFARGGISNNVRKRYLRAMMNVTCANGI